MFCAIHLFLQDKKSLFQMMEFSFSNGTVLSDHIMHCSLSAAEGDVNKSKNNCSMLEESAKAASQNASQTHYTLLDWLTY